MSKVNLVNAYFDGELSKSQVADFESQLKNDSELKSEFDFQNEVVQGLKEARRLELKAMLNNVPVSGAGMSAGGGISLAKIAASVVLLGIVGTGIVWYMSGNDQPQENTTDPIAQIEEVTPAEENVAIGGEEEISDQLENEEVKTSDIDNVVEQPIQEEPQETEQIIEKKEQVDQNNEPVVVVTKPEIKTPEVITSFENTGDTQDDMSTPENGMGSKEKDDMPTIDVDVDNTKKKYSFHYQLKDGRLILYGSFDKGLYEILEFNTASGKNVFLYYKDEYFALSENKEKVTPLVAVKDKTLIQKLMKARGDS